MRSSKVLQDREHKVFSRVASNEVFFDGKIRQLNGKV